MTRPDTCGISSTLSGPDRATEAVGETPELSSRLRALAAAPVGDQERLGYRHTLREIYQQPSAWLTTAGDMVRLGPRLLSFLADAGVGAGCGSLVLTGSGSSFYVAATAGPALQASLGIPVHVIAAGDLLTHPQNTFPPSRPCAIISFGRSGNSPESAAVIDLLLAREPSCGHVVLTCCATGRLATAYEREPRVLAVLLDEQTCDRSLVMTSSFTSMVVAAHYLRFGGDPGAYLSWAERLSACGRHLLRVHGDALAEMACADFGTAVFLGSGCGYGAAREAGLKMTEMTDGRVWAFAETYLGVRHGPMTAIRDDTLVVAFLSSESRVRSYEVDLLAELARKGLGARTIIVGEGVPANLAGSGDVAVECPGLAELGDESAALLDLVAAQLLALFHSLHLGLCPDAPSAEGIINRVVAPFPIYGDD